MLPISCWQGDMRAAANLLCAPHSVHLRRRVIRQLLVESVVIAVIGGALGCTFAAWSLGALLKLAPQDVPRLAQASLNWTVLAFSFGISLLAAMLFGLAPAWRLTRADLLNSIAA